MAIQTAQWAATRIQRPEASLDATVAGDGTPASYHIWTIGCQMNKADSDRLADALEQLGLRPAPSAQHADVVVFNSCVVRQGAEDKVVGALGMAKGLKRQRPERIVALMGCMVGPKKDALED
ncbi:MAG: tRNA (N6-isopentenyl adenosine(37)-C2)-methylthiotransferase MiaB, partial [Chloroflexota bacterium]|nr:tRNA (N6-isopentenyl adenosine(37)-C2)-methylthiotransferase MiaB [Chloroflexota bacterium]